MDQSPIAKAKAELRERVRAAVRSMGEAAHREASARICDLVVSTEAFSRARTVVAFWALPGEPDVRGLMDEASRRGVRICLPRVRGDQVELVRIETVADPVRRSDLGVLEPVGGIVVSLDAVDLALVPGVAFDASGGRLGRGRGFFDRLLGGRAADCPVCGVCFAGAMVESVPMDAHDARVDAVATEAGVVGIRDESRGLWRTRAENR